MYWPYDEVSLKLGSSDHKNSHTILIETPWLKTSVELKKEDDERAQELVNRFNTQPQKITPEYLVDLNWFFKPLSNLPLCYVLPRQKWKTKARKYTIQDGIFQNLRPGAFLKKALHFPDHQENVNHVAEEQVFKDEWKWDAQGPLQFSTTKQGIDPVSLFTTARRYHLLEVANQNSTEKLYAFVKSFEGDKTKHQKASALMVRQNHYVTERCYAALSPALAQAFEAKKLVEDFIQAEYGHDRILNSALKSLIDDPNTVTVLPHAVVLMDLLQFAAHRNFLAFAMLVDFFEKSSYEESDPLATVLASGGNTFAAQQINRHKDINDSGEHENVAIEFLEHMGPIDAAYATEALRIAEATTNVMNLVSTGVQRHLETNFA